VTPESKIEIARRATEAILRRDVDALGKLLAPDCEIVPPSADVEQTVYRGPDAVSRWFAEADEAWESWSSDAESVREGPDWVLGFARFRARGRESGAELDVPAAGVYRFRDGLITAIRVYTSRADALSDLGLAAGPDAATD
jgi:ketosteroid isomerase-like protein